ncbi:hypothetical protein E4U33_000348, partial [Claviceps sp. LM78 group G4]
MAVFLNVDGWRRCSGAQRTEVEKPEGCGPVVTDKNRKRLQYPQVSTVKLAGRLELQNPLLILLRDLIASLAKKGAPPKIFNVKPPNQLCPPAWVASTSENMSTPTFSEYLH